MPLVLNSFVAALAEREHNSFLETCNQCTGHHCFSSGAACTSLDCSVYFQRLRSSDRLSDATALLSVAQDW